MRISRIVLWTVAGIVVLTGVGLLHARLTSAANTLSAHDYLDIQALAIGYARAHDERNIFPDQRGPDPSSVFSEDGVFASSKLIFGAQGGAEGLTINASGQKQLKEYYARILDPKLHTKGRHLAVNHVIKPSPEGATGSVYFYGIEGFDTSKPIAITHSGVYEDIYVKTREGWRIKRRVVHSDRSGS